MNGADHLFGKLFTFRPTDVEADPDHDGEVTDWENNWVSNAFAYISVKLMPKWCQNDKHWTAKFANYFWTSCPCCLIFRGITLGIILGVLLAGLTAAIFALISLGNN